MDHESIDFDTSLQHGKPRFCPLGTLLKQPMPSLMGQQKVSHQKTGVPPPEFFRHGTGKEKVGRNLTLRSSLVEGTASAVAGKVEPEGSQ